MPRLHAISEVLPWLGRQWRPYRAASLLNITLYVIEVALTLMTVWATKLVIDLATGAAVVGYTLTEAAILLVGLMLSDLLLIFVLKILNARLSVRVKNTIQQNVYHTILSADWQVMHSHHSGDMIARLQGDVDSLSSFLSEQLPRFVACLVQFAGAFVFLYLMDARLAIVVLVLIPILAVCSQFYARRLRRFRHEQRDRESAVGVFLQETIQHALVVKSLDRAPLVEGYLRDHHTRLHDVVLRNSRFQASVGLVINCTFVASYLLAFFWGVSGLTKGTITFGAMLAFIQLVGQIQHPVRQLMGYVAVFVNVTTASDRLMTIEQFPSEEKATDSSEEVPTGASLHVSDISFRYAARDGEEQRPIFSHWSADFPQGTITAIIGHTGAGKTTLISLLLGLLRPDEGVVEAEVEGRGRLRLSSATRSLFSYVPQGNTLLSGTIRDNLRYGSPDATEDEMREALHLADADFVFTMKAGLDTPCYERGGGLSEGQAQRVGIARALLKKAPILLLDEAFSSLDTDTADKVLHNILRARPHETLIFITHRESLMPLAQRVLRIGVAADRNS